MIKIKKLKRMNHTKQLRALTIINR